jgi:hypothetical protein
MRRVLKLSQYNCVALRWRNLTVIVGTVGEYCVTVLPLRHRESKTNVVEFRWLMTALCLYTARTVLRQCTSNSAAPRYYACGPNGEDPVGLTVGSACTSMSYCASGLYCSSTLNMCIGYGCTDAACTPPCKDNFYYNVTTSRCTPFQLVVLGYETASCIGTPSRYSGPTSRGYCSMFGNVHLSEALDANWNVRFCTESNSIDTTNWCVR